MQTPKKSPKDCHAQPQKPQDKKKPPGKQQNGKPANGKGRSKPRKGRDGRNKNIRNGKRKRIGVKRKTENERKDLKN